MCDIWPLTQPNYSNLIIEIWNLFCLLNPVGPLVEFLFKFLLRTCSTISVFFFCCYWSAYYAPSKDGWWTSQSQLCLISLIKIMYGKSIILKGVWLIRGFTCISMELECALLDSQAPNTLSIATDVHRTFFGVREKEWGLEKCFFFLFFFVKKKISLIS